MWKRDVRRRLCHRILFHLILCVCAKLSDGGERSTPWDVFSPDLRALAETRDELRQKLQLPGQPVFTKPDLRIGFHSRTFFEPDQPDSVTVDLGRVVSVEAVSLVPVIVDTPLFASGAYGFPRQFRVEFSHRRGFSDPKLVFDSNGVDFPDPGRFPVTFFVEKQSARYVRITSTRHAPNLEHFIWALGELIVLSENQNVAVGMEVLVDRAPSFPPAWSPQNLTDGESIAAIPMVNETSPSNGWLAEQTNGQDSEKWFSVNWGDPVRIDELRLIPARPTDMADTPGLGFPLEYRIEGMTAPGGDWETTFESAAAQSVRTSESSVVVSGIDRDLIAVRVVAERLPSLGGRVQFALAELQAYSGDENVAFEAEVAASDSFADPRFPRWSPQYLVDGYTSQFRLVEWNEYLEKLAARSEAFRRLSAVETRYTELLSRTQLRVLTFTGVVAVCALIAGAILVAGSRRKRAESTRRLREQIARDLHDDIGSNLGGIALISESDAGRSDLPEDVLEDFREIHEIARSSSEAMRDIVWLVQEEKTSVRDLVLRMKATASRLCGNVELSWEESVHGIKDHPVSLEARRHFLLAFKEALHNVARHANAANVWVSVGTSEPERLCFEVRDDGIGFNLKSRKNAGLGLSNFERRAGEVGGRCEIRSSPEDGTIVRFEGALK